MADTFDLVIIDECDKQTLSLTDQLVSLGTDSLGSIIKQAQYLDQAMCF